MPESTGPAAPSETIIAQRGDSVTSLSEDRGFFWETIWNHGDNAELKEKRKDPNIIAPSDSVYFPDRILKWESRATEAKHTFKKKGVPATLKIKVMRLGKPRESERYVLEVDGTLISGTTSSTGLVECDIPPNARCGTLKFNGGKERYAISIGGLDPIETNAGVRQRLKNLGYQILSIDSPLAENDAKDAIKRFQYRANLDVTGDADDATRSAIKDAHS